MGKGKKRSQQLDFNRRVKVEFHGAKVTTDAGLLLYRELDDVLGLTDMAGQKLVDGRRGSNITHTPVSQFRQSVFSRLAGYEDTNDAERLRVDPGMRTVATEKGLEGLGASSSQMGRFETEVLTMGDNLIALSAMLGQWIDRVAAEEAAHLLRRLQLPGQELEQAAPDRCQGGVASG